MTQEHSQTPELLLSDNPYGQTVRWLIDAAPNFNNNQLTRHIGTSLIQEISDFAKKGEIFSQVKGETTGMTETLTYSVDDIFSGQIAAALEAQDDQPEDPKEWKIYIPRANGLRTAVMAIMQDHRLAGPFRQAVYEQQAASAREALSAYSEELHARAEEDLGEEATEASGVALEAVAASRIVSLEQKEIDEDPYDYLRKKLPPVVRPKAAKAKDIGYDYLFGDTQDIPWGKALAQDTYSQEASSETEDDKQRKYYDRFVTEENRHSSQATLVEAIKATPEIREILSKYNITSASIEAVDAIRENSEVRFEVAKVLMQKLDRLISHDGNDIGWRVNWNSSGNLKADQITGKQLRSRVHAVGLALKMIGGEFAERLEGKNDIVRGEDGSVAIGQHRHAARTTLMSHY